MKILTRDAFANESALYLRDSISARVTNKVTVTTEWRDIDDPVFIRYGNSDPVNVPDTEFNSSKFIRLVANKGSFVRLLQQNDFYCPIFHNDRLPARTDYPVLVRSTLRGSGGEGITVCRQENDFRAVWENGCVWTKFIKTSYEYRVHVLGGKVKKLFVKQQVDGIREELPIRNMHRGYHFELCDIQDYPGITKLVKRLGTILSGKMYTLDIGWDNSKKKYFVFEANSASGLNFNTADLYADYLISQLS